MEKPRLFEITRKIERAREEVVREYHPDQLYAFRVGVRTIRSILKQQGSHKSRGFRKTWGGFAAVTNKARDWDVFSITVKKLLTAGEYREFEKTHLEQVQISHDAAIEMMNSAPWHRHIHEWNHFLEQADETGSGMNPGPEALERALSRVRRTLRRALAADDDRRWHKFRIAVKEVRYIAEAFPADPAREQYLAGLIETCKILQTLLGNWHDTVVQLNMLDELEPSSLHDKLTLIIRQRKVDFLSQIRDELALVSL